MKIWMRAMCVVTVLAFGVSANAAMVFLSDAPIGGGVVVGDLHVEHTPADVGGMLYVYATGDQDVDTTWAIDVNSDTPGVVAFVTSETKNPTYVTMFGSTTRWQDVAGGEVGPDAVINMSAAKVNAGVGLNQLYVTIDEDWDVDAGVWLMGMIEYQVVGAGQTTITITEGRTKMVHDGQAVPYEYGNATINVVPEPATMLLLGLGGLAAIRRRK